MEPNLATPGFMRNELEAGDAPHPPPLRLALASVVVLGTFGHLVEIGAPLARPSLPAETVSADLRGRSGRLRRLLD